MLDDGDTAVEALWVEGLTSRRLGDGGNRSSSRQPFGCAERSARPASALSRRVAPSSNAALECFSDIVGAIYRAAGQPELWPDVLKQLASATQCCDGSRTHLAGCQPAEIPRAKPADRRLIDYLTPHIAHAVQMGVELDDLRRRVRAQEDALARLSTAIIVLDSRQQIIFANAAGELLLQNGQELKANRGGLAAVDPAIDESLKQAINRTLLQPDGAGAAETTIAVPRAGGPPLHLLLTRATRSQDLPIPQSESASIFVFVKDPNDAGRLRTDLVARFYGLTPSEKKLLDAVLEGDGLVSVAQKLDISRATASTHLQRIFAKTGTTRQSELIRFVLNFDIPVKSC